METPPWRECPRTCVLVRDRENVGVKLGFVTLRVPSVDLVTLLQLPVRIVTRVVVLCRQVRQIGKSTYYLLCRPTLITISPFPMPTFLQLVVAFPFRQMSLQLLNLLALKPARHLFTRKARLRLLLLANPRIVPLNLYLLSENALSAILASLTVPTLSHNTLFAVALVVEFVA